LLQKYNGAFLPHSVIELLHLKKQKSSVSKLAQCITRQSWADVNGCLLAASHYFALRLYVQIATKLRPVASGGDESRCSQLRQLLLLLLLRSLQSCYFM